jgi:membrane-associated phospholipid phosphatase
MLAGVAALLVDLPLSHWFLNNKLPRPVADLLRHAEVFAHGIGVGIILLTVFVLDVANRWALPRLALLVIGGGLAANIIKLLICRTRPRAFDFTGGVQDTFQGFLPGVSAGSAGQSMPSAHTVATVALAVGLAWLYPRGRWLFGVLATLAAAQRLASGAHFLSDVLWGAALGWFLATGIVQRRFTPGWFDRWEARLAARCDGVSDRTEVYGRESATSQDARAA